MAVIDAFMTGSRIYGKPKPTSDWDIVVRCDRKDALLFGAKSEDDFPDDPEHEGYDLDEDSYPAIFGGINFILCFTDARFQSWKDGTQRCQQITPCARPIAVAIFKELFAKEKEPAAPETTR